MEHYSLGYENIKLGKGVPVVTAPRSTCPDSCPLKNGACYAENPGPLKWHWDKVSSGRRGVPFSQLIEQIKKIPKVTMYRYGQSGDLPGKGSKIAFLEFYQLVKVSRNKRGYAYTHKPVLGNTGVVKKNRELIKWANQEGFIVALSANNINDADEKYNLGIAPVVVSVQSFDNMPRKTPKGRTLVPCPEQTSNGVITCNSCQLCAKPRKCIVAFENTSRRIEFKNNLLGE